MLLLELQMVHIAMWNDESLALKALIFSYSLQQIARYSLTANAF